MKRLHVSVAVSDIDNSIGFYSTLFGTAPTVRKPDYAKWMLEDPRVNFSISSHGTQKGVDHLGIQVDDDFELAVVTERLAKAGHSITSKRAITCCYAKSNKAWAHDPEGVAWETFHTAADSTTYGVEGSVALPQENKTSACCAQIAEAPNSSSCCSPAMA